MAYSLVDVHTGAMERQQALLAAARKALQCARSCESGEVQPSPVGRPGLAALPEAAAAFRLPGRGLLLSTRNRGQPTRDRASRPGTGASGRSSLMSRGSTADGIRLLMSHAPKIELPPPPKSSMSRRLHPLPRRAPKKVQVNVPYRIMRGSRRRGGASARSLPWRETSGRARCGKAYSRQRVVGAPFAETGGAAASQDHFAS